VLFVLTVNPANMPLLLLLPPLQLRAEYVGVMARVLAGHFKTYLAALEKMVAPVAGGCMKGTFHGCRQGLWAPLRMGTFVHIELTWGSCPLQGFPHLLCVECTLLGKP
jgi:hypothetical protein